MTDEKKPCKAREKKEVEILQLKTGTSPQEFILICDGFDSTQQALDFIREQGDSGATYRIVTVHREVKVEDVVTTKRRLV